MLYLGSIYLIVKDMGRSTEFYVKLLEMQPAVQNYDRWTEFHFGGHCIALFCSAYDDRMIGGGKDLEQHYNDAYLRRYRSQKIAYGTNCVLNFGVENLNAEYRRIGALNLGPLSEILFVNISSPYHFFTVSDPDGNTIEITGAYVPEA